MSFIFTPSDGLASLFADEDIAELLSLNSELDAFARFQTALVKAHNANGSIHDGDAAALVKAIEAFKPDRAALMAGMAKDGIMVPAYIRQLRTTLPENSRRHLHLASTSQDVIDTAFMVRMHNVLEIYLTRIDQLQAQLAELTGQFGTGPLPARTRMQVALPATCADRIALWSRPLVTLKARVEAAKSETLAVQFGGPIGTLEALGDIADTTRAHLANNLNLSDPKTCWHTDRTRIVDLGHLMALITGHLGKMGQDIALMAQNGVDEVTLSGGGGSSAMAHKNNPVLAESLVTAARYNSSQSGLLQQVMVQEQERSGAAWTLEWLTLPPMVHMAGASLKMACKMLSSIEDMGTR